MATIGRRAGGGPDRPDPAHRVLGWIAWLVVHLYYLIGFENRVRVLMRWGWYYVRLDRPVRIILRRERVSMRRNEAEARRSRTGPFSRRRGTSWWPR